MNKRNGFRDGDRKKKQSDCLHDRCPDCHGTRRVDGKVCIHNLNCFCRKCMKPYV